MVATILAAFIQVGVKEWIFNNVPNICQQNQVSQLTCPQNQVFYTASAVWWVFYVCFRNFLFINHLFLGVSLAQHVSLVQVPSTIPISTP